MLACGNKPAATLCQTSTPASIASTENQSTLLPTEKPSGTNDRNSLR